MAEEKTLKLSDLNKFFSDGEVQSLEGISIEGEVDLELDLGNGDIGALLAASFGQEIAKVATNLINFSRAMGYPVDPLLQQSLAPQPTAPPENKYRRKPIR